jgi:hypothetical protein
MRDMVKMNMVGGSGGLRELGEHRLCPEGIWPEHVEGVINIVSKGTV